MGTSPALTCESLVKEFNRTRAVDQLSLTVPAGEVFGLLGPNGSGKTTTIRVCMGIYPPDQGSVQILGSPDPLSVRYQVGYLPEERGLYAKMKVQEQLAFLGSLRGLSLRDAEVRAGRWLERLGLADRAQSLTNELSKGMQQKVQFASAVMHEPDIVVLDEPFSGLDPINSRLLKDLILEQKANGATVVLSTHRMEQVEALCDGICLIHQGRAVLNGRLAEIKSSYGKSTLAVEYEGDPNALQGLPGVREVNDAGRRARLQLEAAADHQEILKLLLERVRILAFKLEEPHIEEIYLDKVTGTSTQNRSEGART